MYGFKNILAEKLAISTKISSFWAEKMIITLVFKKKKQFFSQKIAENCDHNIGPGFTVGKKNLDLGEKLFLCLGGSLRLAFRWCLRSGVARWYIFIPKIPIWVNF
jgi:hypothetical protein